MSIAPATSDFKARHSVACATVAVGRGVSQ